MARRTIAPIKDFESVCAFEDPTLVPVVTLSEACLMWEKSETAMMHAILKGKINARRAFTGGDWLLSRVSVIRRYGQPKKDIVCQLLK